MVTSFLILRVVTCKRVNSIRQERKQAIADLRVLLDYPDVYKIRTEFPGLSDRTQNTPDYKCE